VAAPHPALPNRFFCLYDTGINIISALGRKAGIIAQAGDRRDPEDVCEDAG